MTLEQAYQSYFTAPVSGRYITLEHVLPLLKTNTDVAIFKTGVSEKGTDIPVLKIGTGTKKMLAWSQMHGNESTTTKAVLDFLQFINQQKVFQKEKEEFLTSYTLYIVPILNPDGAKAYTRENANDIDLNRDAKDRTQKESKLLHTLFTKIKPDLCLNLHDQRTIYGLENNQPATVSFLAPAANKERTITPARKTAMEGIVKMNYALQAYIPGQVGRYDDSFNENCVGDCFTAAGVPTILFEAGQFPNDYQREKTREFIFYALLELFDCTVSNEQKTIDYKEYVTIPENKKNFRDVILRDVYIEEEQQSVSVAIQYKEEVSDGKVRFIPIIEAIGNLSSLKGHTEIAICDESILMNSHKNFNISDKILTIHYKNNGKEIIFQ